MLIGPRGCGKSTLAKYINQDPKPVRRTQDTIYGKETIDVPSAYLENTWMYRHLIALAQDAWCMVMMLDQRKKERLYSHGFAKAFRCPIIGVMTHCEDAVENREVVLTQFEELGIEPPYFEIDLKSGKGVQDLLRYVEDLKERKGIQ